tara:strand:+ start:286 stop:561 length:276 start_codon:yes stop_codon:yes gene_type:complete
MFSSPALGYSSDNVMQLVEEISSKLFAPFGGERSSRWTFLPSESEEGVFERRGESADELASMRNSTRAWDFSCLDDDLTVFSCDGCSVIGT